MAQQTSSAAQKPTHHTYARRSMLQFGVQFGDTLSRSVYICLCADPGGFTAEAGRWGSQGPDGAH